MHPAETMDLSLREFVAFARGRRRAIRAEMQRRLWQSWETANFVRAKRLPDLKMLMRKLDDRGNKQTPKQLLNRARVINAMLGGSERKRPVKEA